MKKVWVCLKAPEILETGRNSSEILATSPAEPCVRGPVTQHSGDWGSRVLGPVTQHSGD